MAQGLLSGVGGVLFGDPGAGLRDQGQYNFRQSTRDSNDLIKMLQQQASGTGPSITGMQLRQALDQSRAQQSSMAAGARPGGQAAAMRMAMQNQGRMSTEMGGQAAMAALQEQMAARQALAQFLAQKRAQDLNQWTGGAGMQDPGDRLIGAIGAGAQLAAAGSGKPPV